MSCIADATSNMMVYNARHFETQCIKIPSFTKTHSYAMIVQYYR